MTRCHVCSTPRVREIEPAFGPLPADVEEDVHWIALRNGLYFPACFEHWFTWPDDHKRWPDEGYGQDRSRVHVVYDDHGEIVEYELLPANSEQRPSPISIDGLVALLRETT